MEGAAFDRELQETLKAERAAKREAKKAAAEKRKAAADYDEHERYNVKVDALTHAITPDMPLYISFRRTGRRQTQLWYEPTEHENVGHGTCHEVTGDVYRLSLIHI